MTNGICKKKLLKEKNMSSLEKSKYSPSFYTEEDELVQVHSPTDSSENSVEVKVNPISFRNIRKDYDYKKLDEYTLIPPPKKRICLQISEEERRKSQEPFRPWNVSEKSTAETSEKLDETLNDDFSSEPLSLLKKSSSNTPPNLPSTCTSSSSTSTINDRNVMRVPFHPSFGTIGCVDVEKAFSESSNVFPGLKSVPGQPKQDSQIPTINVKSLNCLIDQSNNVMLKKEQRNYKNMTRERRIEANARERTRVHTISAAFDTLRRSIPSYSHNQKLSKLSVLRIACSYIATLSNIVTDTDENTLLDSVENVTRTIQREGKLRKKKDDSD